MPEYTAFLGIHMDLGNQGATSTGENVTYIHTWAVVTINVELAQAHLNYYASEVNSDCQSLVPVGLISVDPLYLVVGLHGQVVQIPIYCCPTHAYNIHVQCMHCN